METFDVNTQAWFCIRLCYVELSEIVQLKLISSVHRYNPRQGRNSLSKHFVILKDAQLLF